MLRRWRILDLWLLPQWRGWGPGDRGSHGCQGGVGRAGADSVGFRNEPTLKRTLGAHGTERTLGVHGPERVQERTLWAHGTERAPLLTLPWRPSRSDAEPGWDSLPATHQGCSMASWIWRARAGLPWRRPGGRSSLSPTDFPEVPGVLLNAPISLTDVKELPRWTHAGYILSRHGRGASKKNRSLCPNAGKHDFNEQKRPTGKNKTERDTTERNCAGVLASREQNDLRNTVKHIH